MKNSFVHRVIAPLLKMPFWQKWALLSLILVVINGAFIAFLLMHTKPDPVKVTTTVAVRPVDTDVNLLSGTWRYMPGVTVSSDHLTVNPLTLSIAEQDGSTYYPNPSINRVGTYLHSITGDMQLQATVNLKTATSASIYLYGELPLIADEFRIERESIWLTFTKDHVDVAVWSASSPSPQSKATFRFTPAEILNLKLSKKGDNLEIDVNNISAGTVTAANVFATKQMWVGLSAEGSSWDLSKFSLPKNDGALIEVADASSLKVASSDSHDLQVKVGKTRPDMLIGSAVALGPLVSDSQYSSVALSKNTFGSLTAENEMKMINLQPERGKYNFASADGLLHLANQNGITNIHGHTLVFGEANPQWVTQLPTVTSQDKATVEKVMKDHITQVVSHFGTKVSSWDVINEPLADYDEFEQGQVLRTHVWQRAMGDDFMIKALQTAYLANPKALLFINEFGLESEGERWDSFLEIMKKLKVQLESLGIPVSQVGVGFQSHIYDSDDKVNTAELKKHFGELADLGYKAQISEIDVYSGDGDAVQASQYSQVLSACIDSPNCIAYRVWILSDRYNLYKDEGQIHYGIDGLFDKDMRPRPAFDRLQQTVK